LFHDETISFLSDRSLLVCSKWAMTSNELCVIEAERAGWSRKLAGISPEILLWQFVEWSDYTSADWG